MKTKIGLVGNLGLLGLTYAISPVAAKYLFILEISAIAGILGAGSLARKSLVWFEDYLHRKPFRDPGGLALYMVSMFTIGTCSLILGGIGAFSCTLYLLTRK